MEYRDPTPISPDEIDYDESKVDTRVSHYTKQVREKMHGIDTREAMARAEEISSVVSTEAKEISVETKGRQDILEQQFDDQIANMTLEDPSSAEIVAAQTNRKTGENWQTIGNRLDEENNRLTAQLATKAPKVTVDNLQSQINSIVLQGTSGDSSAELAQTKVGLSGQTFSTLKGRADDIEKQVSEFVDLKYSIVWKIGGLTGTSPTYRISTSDLVYASKDLRIVIKNPSLIYPNLWIYDDSSGTSYVDRGWKTEDFTIKAGTYFKMMIRKAVEDTVISTPRDSILLDGIEIRHNEDFNTIKDKIDPSRIDESFLKALVNVNTNTTWELGSVDGSNGYLIPSTTRVRSSFIRVGAGSVIRNKFTAKYRWSVTTYRKADDKTLVENSGWLTATEFKVVDDGYIIILIEDATSIEEASIIDIWALTPKTSYFEDGTITPEKLVEGIFVNSYSVHWEIGSLNGNDGSNVVTNARLRTSDYIGSINGKVINQNTNMYQIAVNEFDINKKLVLNTGWMNVATYTPQHNKCMYFKVVLSRKDGADFTGTTEGNIVSITGSYLKLMEYISGFSDGGIGSSPSFVKGISHRGYFTAPENTLPAYKLSKKLGFDYVETDVSFTSDGVPVLLHDDTINRTSNGTGNIGSLTLAQVKSYDFGSWKSSEYAGVEIPTFEEFISLCRKLSLHPYIEIKANGSYTQEQMGTLVSIVKKFSMSKNVTWISYSAPYLSYIKQHDPKARLGLVANQYTSNIISTTLNLRNDENEVFVDADYSIITQSLVNDCITNDLPLEVWTINEAASILSLDPYISGVTSDSLNAGKIFLES